MISHSLILLMSIFIAQAQRFYGDPQLKETETFDFIIVGSGPSGAVLANRLTEVNDWKVLLLEAGEEPIFLADIPILANFIQFTNYNWGYKAEKSDKYCLGCENGRMSWPRGKVLGGSSILNYMIATRGNRLDYDRWAQMGNQGWSYEGVLPYFKKSEDAHVRNPDVEYRGQGGYLSVSDDNYVSEVAKVFVKAARQAGYPYVDYNGRSQLGVSYIQATTKGGFRFSSEKAFLRPVRHRKNLKIVLKARVVKVLIDDVSKKAVGVKVIKNKKYYHIKATKEVLLCAGVFNSPQLLMLSGIGPKNHLNELGIPVIQDLPVGQKLYDHLVCVGMTYSLNESISHNLDEESKSLPNYIYTGDGPPSSTGVEALAFTRTNSSTEPPSLPNIELVVIGGGINADGGAGIRREFSISEEVYDTIWKPLKNDSLIQIFPMLIYPKSVGFMKLKSKNPFHWPKFYPQYLSDTNDTDLNTLLEGLRECQRIANTPAFQKYGATLVTTKIPGCEAHKFDSDNYWKCVIRHVSATLYHQVGTCKMGTTDDPEAVVDSQLRVYGIENLRVVDVSIMPTEVAGHSGIPAYMIGEKAADMIKERWAPGSEKGKMRNP